MLGKTLGHYEITSRIGAGGMGEVWRARDKKLGRDVAIKILPADLASQPERVHRFQREARAVAALNHPNIVTIHSVEEEDGIHFLTMELVEGQSLDHLIPSNGMGLSEFLAIAVPLADALAAAHDKGIVHRDLKPANVMVTERAQPKILDFGLAKILEPGGAEPDSALATEGKTREGVVMGTAPYMSPEQLQGQGVDHRTDIFSLGVLFYEMASGERPFAGSSAAALLSAVLRDRPKPLRERKVELPELLSRIVARCLEKNADDRFQTAQEVQAQLETLSLGIDLAPGPASRTPLVGREHERADLERMLESAVQGTGGLALLGGEPGVGKTRLAEEILRTARGKNFLALTGRCSEEGSAPFAPFAEILEAMARAVPPSRLERALGDVAAEAARLAPSLKRLLPNLAEPIELPPELRQRYLFNGLLEFLQRLCEERPIVLLLDDLHWADDLSLAFVEHLAPQLASISLLLLGTYRDVELDVGKPFEKTLAVLVRQRLAKRLAVKRLTKASVGELLGALGGGEPPDALVAAIHEETEGNPFFVEEVFHHLSEEGKLFDDRGEWKSDLSIDELDVPEGVRLVIGRRLARLSEETPAILTSAAVLGPRFSLDVLEALHEGSLDAVEEAEAAKLVEPRSSSGREALYGFTHELIRQTLLTALSLPRRQRLHLRIADAIEKVRAARLAEHVSELAHHLYMAGSAADAGKTVHYLELAGERALASGASEQALELFQRALSLLEDADERGAKEADLLERRALAHRGLGQFEAMESDLRAALALYERNPSREGAARASASLAFHLLWSNRCAEAESIAERGLASVGQGDSKERCRLLSSLAVAQVTAGKPDEAESGCAEAVAMARRLGDGRLLAEVLRDEAFFHLDSFLVTRLAYEGENAAELQRSIQARWELSSTLGVSSLGWFWLGRFDEMERIDREAVPLARRYADLGAEYARNTSSLLKELARGNLAAHVECSRANVELCRRAGIPISMSYGVLARGLFWQGRADEALEVIETGLSLDEEWGSWRGTTAAARFVMRASAGEREALSFLEEPDLLPRPGVTNRVGSWHCLMAAVEGLALLGERERAGALYPLTLELMKTGARLSWFGLTERTAAIAAACAGRWQEAERHFDTAQREAAEIPHRLEQAEVRRWYGWMLLARGSEGDRERARALLGEARALYEEMGMPTHVAQSDAFLEDCP